VQHLSILPYVGEKIAKEEGARRLAHKNAYIFALNDRYDIDGQTRTNTARYINHSCRPNCEAITTARTIWIVALRDIKNGEELSYNYGYGAEDYAQYPCHCGAEQCCGYMLDRRYWGVITTREGAIQDHTQSQA
jgi:SET domain-containing protein